VEDLEKQMPWYDSNWLIAYKRVKELILLNCPQRLDEFVRAFEILKTRDNFVAAKLDKPVFDVVMLEKSRRIIKDLTEEQHEKHEVSRMDRTIVHNHPYFIEVQKELVDLVSDLAGEPVEPYYNFLCMYSNLGVCEVHMDTPEAKWTLDVCIDQSAPWPIHFSQVRPWPELGQYTGDGWQEQIKNDPDNHFSSLTLSPGEGLFFAGSSQWHYREKIKKSQAKNYCHLIFFHYVPKGTRDLVNTTKWLDKFDFLELALR